MSYRLSGLEKRDGKFVKFPIEATISHTNVRGKKLLGATLREVTKHIRSAETLRESEAGSRSVVLGSPVAMAITRLPEETNLLVNEKFTELFGYTSEDIPDVAHWWPLAYPDSAYREKVRAEWQARVQTALELNRAMEPMEAAVKCKDGSHRFVEFHSASLGDTLIVTFVDRTERHLGQVKLRESEERFSALADAAPVLIWMSGLDRLCTYVSKRWLEFTGRTLQQELGSGWLEGVHPDDVAHCADTYFQAFDRRESFHIEYRLRRDDGEYRWVYDAGVPRYDSEGEFAGYIGSCIDVTERRAAERALSRLGQRLIQAQEDERSRIARELHDDIGQRLAVLAYTLQSIGTNGKGSSSLAGQKISEAVNLVRNLAGDVHSLSHRLHSGTLDHLGLVMGAAGLCREISERQGVQVDFQSTGVSKKLSREISLCLFRVLQEALQNAVKHSGAQDFKVALTGSPNTIELMVQDAGIGFRPRKAEKGSGLGLLSMRERLKSVDGDLFIESEPLRGTTIRARAPITR